MIRTKEQGLTFTDLIECVCVPLGMLHGIYGCDDVTCSCKITIFEGKNKNKSYKKEAQWDYLDFGCMQRILCTCMHLYLCWELPVSSLT